ncbi:MAG: KDO2-lipid IV(A) lauroyltransferase, partial [Candidatus Omnitrophota bacterium]
MSERSKKFQRAFARYIFFIIFGIIRIMPYCVFKFFSGFFLWVTRCLMTKRKKLIGYNLDLAYGDTITSDKKNEMINDIYNNISKGVVDLIYFISRPEEVRKRVSIEGLEHLEKALEQNKGAIFLSAHFGIFVGVYFKMALEGYG